MSGVRKKQEDKNLKIFRELLTFENNKFCFDCNQRGPSYVNITVGSFVCTNCGGALRKYSHRVKSISMSNFSQVEMDFLKKRGNNICKKIYYGLCDNSCPPEVDINNGMLDSHLRAKYELKKWYLEPTPKLEEETIRQNQTIFDRGEMDAPRLSKGYTVNSASNIIIELPKPPGSRITLSKVNKTSIDVAEMPTKERRPSLDVGKHSMDVPKLSGTTTVTTKKLPIQRDQKSDQWHSNFDPKSNASHESPFGDDFQVSPHNFSMPPLAALQQTTVTSNATAAQTCNRLPHASDKYSVLAELDDLFSSASIAKRPPNETTLAPAWDTGAIGHSDPWSSAPVPTSTTSSTIAGHVSITNPFACSTLQHTAASPPSSNPFLVDNLQSQAHNHWYPSASPTLRPSSVNPFMNNAASTNPFL